MFYSFFCILVIFAALKARQGISAERPIVSVIVAARNEENNIEACVKSIINQDYPVELFEIIISDDRSEDKTSEILEKLKSNYANLKSVRIDKTPDGWSPKKYALSKALETSSGVIILQTDADCYPSPGWISSMVSRFEPDVNMVCGPAPYNHGKGIINSFVRHEYIWNIALAAGSISLGLGTHASGRNLAFRKKIFYEIGGYGTYRDVISGDDTLLLKLMTKYNGKGVVFNPAKAAQVYTEAPGNIRNFIRQRTRHMSTGKLFNPVQLLTGAIVYSFHIFLLFLITVTFFSIECLLLFLGLFCWKCLIDLWAARKVKYHLGVGFPAREFVFNELILILYMSVMPVLGLVVPVVWKEKS